MKKKDLVETGILLLGLWLLYRAITSLAHLISYSYFQFTSNVSPENTFEGYIVVYLLHTICCGFGVYLCFRKRNWLIHNTGLNIQDETSFSKEITKYDMLETGIIVLSIGTAFLTFPDFLDNCIRFLKSKISDSNITYEFTLPFFYFLLPLIALIYRDRILDLLYPEYKKEE